MPSGSVLFQIFLIHFLFPGILAFFISEFMRKRKWILMGKAIRKEESGHFDEGKHGIGRIP